MVDVASLTPGETLRGHIGMVMGLAVSPDGQTLWSAGRDADLIAWDLGGQRRLQRTRELPARSLLGQVSQDGSTAITWQRGRPRRSRTPPQSWTRGQHRRCSGRCPAGRSTRSSMH